MHNDKPETQIKPRIAIVIPKYGLVGGSERFVYELTERLANTGRYEFHVYAHRWQSGNSSIHFHKIPSIRFPRFLRALWLPWFMKKVFEKEKYDIIHSHEKIYKADIISLHGFPHERWVKNVRKKSFSLFDLSAISVERSMIEHGSHTTFLPVSSIALEEYQKAYTRLNGTWHVMHPGVDVQRFSAVDRQECRRGLRGQYGIVDSDILILFVGMNFEVKGLDICIQSIARVRQINPDIPIKLLVVGRGDKNSYSAMAQALGVGDAVLFAGEQAVGIEQYYNASDIFMLLSAHDTFGMVVLEAMAASLPVIISAHVGAKDIVEEGKTGFIITNRNNVDEIVQRIIELSDKVIRTSYAEKTVRAAIQYDWDCLANRTEKLYQKHITKTYGRIL